MTLRHETAPTVAAGQAPSTEDELEELLSRPGAALVRDLAALPGDVVILGVGGKMGPSLARLARRAADLADGGRGGRRIVGVSRFSEAGLRDELEQAGVDTIAADLLDPAAVERLPDAPHVIFMAGRKFGSTGGEPLTWAMNSLMPALVARRYAASRLVAFSSGNVYPLVPIGSGGATESTPPEPIGEYAQSVLGRERIFEYACQEYGLRATLLRLNYAIDLRYGILLDVAQQVQLGAPVDVTMGQVNVIWQGDANAVALRALALASSPPTVLNLTGPETVAVRWLVSRLAAALGVEGRVVGQEAPTALLNNAARCHGLFGYPSVTLDQMVEWVAHWVRQGGPTLGKPTHFQEREGKF
ncbi:MAG TPA: NAD-dependent epimerase/dehydratase family protein [Chloroflexota bacterium]|nr:NAD-dependent epimerase/dehydratase family protein [Chloroflexota bacterium]